MSELHLTRGMAAEGVTRTPAHLFDGGAAGALSPETVHVNRPLTNMVAAYPNRDYVADRVAPILAVRKLSDLYWVIPQKQAFQAPNPDLASPEAKPNVIRSELSTSSYYCKYRSLMGFLPNSTLLNADAPLNVRAIVAGKVRNALLLNRELRVCAALNTVANYGTSTTTLTASNRFDDPTSDPVKVIDDARRQMRMLPNKLAIGHEAFLALIRHPRIKEMIQGRNGMELVRDLAASGGATVATPARMNAAILASVFELDEVVVFKGFYDSGPDGGTEVLSPVWQRDMVALLRVADAPDIMNTTNMIYTFRFVGDMNPDVQNAAAPTAAPIQFRSVPDLIAGGIGGEYEIGVHADDETIIGGAATGWLLQTAIS